MQSCSVRMLEVRGLRVLACLVGSTTIGCADGPNDPGGGRITVAIAPLTYLDASDACYTLTTYDGGYRASDPMLGIVWRQVDICGSRYGADAEITYTDGGAGGVGLFWTDTDWTGYVPAFQLTAY